MADMIIAIANQKGGSAKTTTTLSLGAALADLGKRVLLLDMDPQGHLAEGLGMPAEDLAHDISEVFDRKVELPTIILNVRDNLDLAPANIKLSYVEGNLFNMRRREDRLKMALSPLAASYDYVLIDCPPSLGLLTINALSAADTVLIPMAAEFYAMLGVRLLLQTIRDIQDEINPGLSIIGLIPTRVTRTSHAKGVLDHIHEELNGRVRIFEPGVPESVRLKDASGAGKTIFELQPDHPSALAYRALAEEIARG